MFFDRLIPQIFRIPVEMAVIAVVALSLGMLRQQLHQGIAWNGQWPTSATSAEDAFKMLAKPGDPSFIGLSELIPKVDSSRVRLLDARSNKEFVLGRLPGARNLPYYELDAYQDQALAGLEAESEIVIYCEGIGCELSFFLGRDLTAAGYTNIRIFYGGYPEWQRAGLPIEK